MGSSIVVAPRAEPARETARYFEKSRRGVRSGRRRAYGRLVALLLAVNSSRSLAGVSVKDQARTKPVLTPTRSSPALINRAGSVSGSTTVRVSPMWINTYPRPRLSDPHNTPPGRSTRRTLATSRSCAAASCRWCSIVTPTTELNRASSNGSAVASPSTTSTLPHERVCSLRATLLVPGRSRRP